MIFLKNFSKFLLNVSALSFLFLGCSESPNTAGVFSETESGQTTALIGVALNAGAPSENANVHLLAKNYNAKQNLAHFETSTDSLGNFRFDSIPEGDYHLLIEDETQAFSALSELHFKDSLELEIALDKNARLTIALDFLNATAGDTLCIVGTYYCAAILEDALFENEIIFEVPTFTYRELALAKMDGARNAIPVDFTVLAGEDIFINENYTATYKSTLNIEVNDSLLTAIDSLNKPQKIDSILAKISLPNSIKNPLILNNKGEEILLKDKISEDADSSIYWATIPSIARENLNYKIYENKAENSENGGVLFYAENLNENTTHSQKLFVDSSFAMSFAISLKEPFEQKTIFSAIEDNVGFAVETCGAKDICVRIYTGLDSNLVDSTLYGKFSLEEGKEHLYTFAIYQKHLVIALDGKILRNTDLKINDALYKLNQLEMNPEFFELKNVLIFDLPKTIREKNDMEWERLKLWLQLFQNFN